MSEVTNTIRGHQPESKVRVLSEATLCPEGCGGVPGYVHTEEGDYESNASTCGLDIDDKPQCETKSALTDAEHGLDDFGVSNNENIASEDTYIIEFRCALDGKTSSREVEENDTSTEDVQTSVDIRDKNVVTDSKSTEVKENAEVVNATKVVEGKGAETMEGAEIGLVDIPEMNDSIEGRITPADGSDDEWVEV